MKGEMMEKGIEESNRSKKLQDVENFTPFRCPTPGCRQVYFDISSELLKNQTDVLCLECQQQPAFLGYCLIVGNPGVLELIFLCLTCRKNLTCQLIGLRKFCKGCKRVRDVYLHLTVSHEQK